MVRPRVVETDEGIQGEFETSTYDRMVRRLRDKGWMETETILKAGITRGVALEVGPGPGYLGLEWLRRTEGTSLKALDISPGMIEIAQRNAGEYGLTDRVEYRQGDARHMSFEDSSFDAAFTGGSLHEWSDPMSVLNEIHRVLRPGGRYVVTDLRRDMFPLMKWLMWLATKPREIRPGLITSINAAYTAEELRALLDATAFKNATVTENLIGLTVVAPVLTVKRVESMVYCF